MAVVAMGVAEEATVEEAMEAERAGYPAVVAAVAVVETGQEVAEVMVEEDSAMVVLAVVAATVEVEEVLVAVSALAEATAAQAVPAAAVEVVAKMAAVVAKVAARVVEMAAEEGGATAVVAVVAVVAKVAAVAAVAAVGREEEMAAVEEVADTQSRCRQAPGNIQ